ncbi:MAG: response regulator [Oleibacter sp.]|nr:response regulator [Thalassolituus sp.]
MSRLIIIDDDDTFRDVLQRRLEQYTDFKIESFASAQSALSQSLLLDEHDTLPTSVQTPVHAILLDMMMNGESGLDAIVELTNRFSPTHLIILTGYASIATTVEAMRRGATDYITKPVGLQELLTRIGCGKKNTQSEASTFVADAKPMTPAQVEWEHIQRVLLENNNNVSATAEALGMHRRSLQRKLQKFSPNKQ